MKMGSVYFIKIEDMDIFKIGHVLSHLERRITDIRIGNPFRISFFGVINSLDAPAIERTLHRQFKPCKMQGEWYSITEAEAVDAIRKNGGALVEPEYKNKWHGPPGSRKRVANTCRSCDKSWVGARKAGTCSPKCRKAKSRKLKAEAAT